MQLNARGRHHPISFFALLLILVVLPSQVAALGDHPPASNTPWADTLAAQVDELFADWHRPDSPGAAVLVVRDGEILHGRGYGMASLEHGVPIDTRTVFDIASVSKQFAAFAVALLEAEGALSVDDDVRSYIPELPDFGHTITIRHLIHHTSGLRDWPGTLSMGGWDYEDVLSFEQILRMARHQEDLNFVPGSEYAYSNTGYNLLAEIVARVSGTSFRAFTRERIFQPLGMHQTHFHDDHGEVIPGRAESYRPRGGADTDGHRRVTNNLTALGSSSLFTTVEDLARWIRNFDEPVVGGAGVVERMYQQGVLNDGDTIGYAWGQTVGSLRGLTAVSHGGSWAGYRTTLLRFPEQRLAVVILANTSDMNPGSMANRIAQLYLADELPPEVAESPAEDGRPGSGAGQGTVHEDPEPWTPAPEALEEYTGVYTSPELATAYTLELRDGVLVAAHFRRGDRAFRPVEPDRFQGSGFGEIRFLRDDLGNIVAFTANQTRIRGLRFERIP